MPENKPNLSDKEKQEEYFKKTKIDYESVFSTPAGTRVLDDICKSAYVNRSSFDTDALNMARNEGMRIVAMHILTMAKVTVTEKEENKVAIT